MASVWSRKGSSVGRSARAGPLSVRDAANWLRDYLTAIKHGQFHPFTPIERKTREATRNEAWGPTGTVLNELAEATNRSDYCQIIYAVVEARLQYPAEKWRNVYKGLQVLEFLIKRGSDECVMLAQADLRPYVQNVRNFEYIGPDGRDYGINVRVRADAIVRLLDSDQELKQERAQLKRRARQFKGFSREEMENNEVIADLPPRSNSWAGSTRNDDGADEETHGRVEIAKQKRAGEMKGVTEAENKKQLRLLKLQLASRGNRRCSDCLSAERPSWASINCGVFLCMKCAGIHRGLGVHVSQVRSCTLDTWLPEQVKFMSQTGNNIANSYWEAKMPPNLKPGPDDPNLGRFIRRKYANREWADGPWPPATASVQNENVHPQASLSPSTSGRTRAAGLHIAKHPSMKSAKPPFGVARQQDQAMDSPFQDAADWGAFSGGQNNWAAGPSAGQHGVRAASADPQSPLSSVVINPHPFPGTQGQGLPHASSYPETDLMHFGDSGDYGQFVDQPAAQRQLPRGVAQQRVQMHDMLYESHRQRGFTEPMEGVIRTTELRIEDDDVIHTTELNLDDLDVGMAKPVLSSADGILQSTSDYPEFSGSPWMDSDMKPSSSSLHDMGFQQVGMTVGGGGGPTPRPGTPDTDTPHVSVTFTVDARHGHVSAAPVPVSQPPPVAASAYARQGAQPGSGARPSLPAYLDHLYLADQPQAPPPPAAAPGLSRDPLDELSSAMHNNLMDAPVLSWDSRQDVSGGGSQPRSNNPFADVRSGQPAEVPSLPNRPDPWGQPLSPAPLSPGYGAPSSFSWAPNRVGAPHGVVMGDAGSRGREDSGYVASQFAGVHSSHAQLPFQQGAGYGQPSSGSYTPQGGLAFTSSPGPGYSGGQLGEQHGRRSSGAGGSSGGASDELERMLYSQVEGLAMGGQSIGTRAPRACFSPQKKMSMAEMRSHRVGATGSSGSG